MAFSQAETDSIANAVIKMYLRGDAVKQSIQDKPLLAALDDKKKTFAASRDTINENVVGDYTTAIAGYTHNDTVTYTNPANIKQSSFSWYEVHAGITVTLTELKKSGISVVDSINSKEVSRHTNAELAVITDLLENKLQDMMEGWARSFNLMLWKDGTQDAKAVPGIQSMIADDPATGTVGGLDRATLSWWRNRALVGSNKITASASNQTLTQTLRREVRQLTRYGGKPNLVLCGSGFLDALETEVQAKGQYTQEGFMNKGKLETGLADIYMRGVGRFKYDPTLDDLSLPKRCFIIDTNAIKLRPMEGEDKKVHNPARPYDQYTMYRAITWTGGLTARQLNGCGVYEVA